MSRIPPTIHGLNALYCISALQKFIRRAMEREAMEVAVELHLTSKAFATMLCNRLEVISHEDLDTAAAPHVVPFVHTAMTQARTWYDPAKLGRSRMPIGNAIRLMCRAPKSREGDHFQAAIGWRAVLEEYAPELPDWIHDQHTTIGKRAGRGLEYFRETSTQLVPPPATKDAYEDEAYRMWALKAQREGPQDRPEQSHRQGDLLSQLK